MKEKKYIAILGPGSACPEELISFGLSTGKYIASNEWVTIAGGLSGVFDAAFRGARGAGGETLSVISKRVSPYEGACQLVLSTGSELIKRAVIAESCDGAIMIGGWLGTVSLLSLIISQKKPVVAIRNTGGASSTYADRFLINPDIGQIKGASDPKEAVSILESEFDEQ